MFSKHLISVEVDVEFDVTQSVCIEIIQSIIEFLAYYRNQIPFPYETFHYMVNENKKLVVISEDNKQCDNYLIIQQLHVAEKTLNSFLEIFQNISKEFENYEIEKVAILFGATVLTPKEAFVISLPDITKRHSQSNDKNSSRSLSKKVILSIIKSKAFVKMNMAMLKPTNMFILIKPKTIKESMITSTVTSIATNRNESIGFYSDFFQPITQLYLPKTCKTTNIHIISYDHFYLNSQGIVIYKDHSNDECGDVHKNVDSIIANDEVEHNEIGENNSAEEIWYESNVFIKGFKDALVNGKNMWNNTD